MRRLVAPFVAIAMVLGAPWTAFGQEAGAPAAPAAAPGPAPWEASCNGGGRREALNCRIEQRVVMSNTGQLLTAVSVQLPADASQPTMLIQTPLGLSLPAGLKLSIDENEVLSLPLRTCEASGCYADTPVSDDLVAAMQRGQTLTVTFEDVRQNQIGVPVSLFGFTAALEKAR